MDQHQIGALAHDNRVHLRAVHVQHLSDGRMGARGACLAVMGRDLHGGHKGQTENNEPDQQFTSQFWPVQMAWIGRFH